MGSPSSIITNPKVIQRPRTRTLTAWGLGVTATDALDVMSTLLQLHIVAVVTFRNPFAPTLDHYHTTISTPKNLNETPPCPVY